jgi:hypothetical protein
MAGVQPTIPAKQQRMSTLPRTLSVSCNAVAMADSLRTSTAQVVILVLGNLECRVLTVSKACSGFRSQRARPVRPCSRREVAASRARVPAPPVTGWLEG